MPKCLDCAWFPWDPGADVSMMPVQRCHPELKARRWPGETAKAEQDCLHFEPREGLEDEKKEHGKPEMTVAQLKEHIDTITDPSEIERLLAEEQALEDPRKTAVSLLEEKLKALKGKGTGDPEMTVDQLKEHAESITNPAEIERLLTAEQELEEPRETAIALLEEKLRLLKGENNDDPNRRTSN